MDDIEIGNPEDGELGAADPVARLKKLKERLSACETEKAEYLEGWQRAKAELLNSKKDEARRFAEWRERLEEALILEFLPVLDSFELAGTVDEKHAGEEMRRGFEMIRLQLRDTFRRLGVAEIPTDIPFNPVLHEAIEEVESGEPPGSIAEVLQRGYERNGRVLRPARVKVTK